MSTEIKPVDTPEFWKRRIYWACSTGRGTHTAIYDTSPESWQKVQNETLNVLRRHCRSGDRLLDAGCGYGATCAYIPHGVRYTGIDLSPDLIEIARLAYPDGEFIVGDMRSMPQFKDKHFNVAICRSIRKMIIDNCGSQMWDDMERELRRVSRKVIILEYEDMLGV